MKRRLPQRSVWHVANGFGYAGTEGAMETWCLGLARRGWAVSAFARLEGGPRLARLRRAGVRAAVLGQAPSAWRRELDRRPCDLLHIHRHGEADAGWDAIIAAARAAGVRRVVQTNVFGAHDRRGLGPTLDHHFYVSAMCLWRWAGWPRALPEGHLQRHSVLYNPLRLKDLPDFPVSQAQQRAARKALGLPEDAFVLGRLGRPDVNKWPAWLPAAFAALLRRVPRARLLLMQAPAEGVQVLRSLGVEGACLFLEAGPDWGRVRRAYQALDVLAHASRVGESFGYTLAEAQALGIPVVVDSTPWADNGQVEVVRHGLDGLVAGRPAAFVDALAMLAGNPDLGRRLGRAGFGSARRRFGASVQVARLEACYKALLEDRPLPEQAWVEGFGEEYARRLEARHDPRPWADAVWGLRAKVRLYARGWASRALKFWRWGR